MILLVKVVYVLIPAIMIKVNFLNYFSKYNCYDQRGEGGGGPPPFGQSEIS